MASYVPTHTNFNLAFKEGHVFKSKDREISVRVVNCGNLNLPSGRIAAFDPGIVDPEDIGTYAFKTRVVRGSYASSVSIASVGDNHERVAASMIQFKSTEPVRWEMAVTRYQDIAELEAGQIYGYGVDCGTGAFADPVGFDGVDDYEAFTEQLWNAMDINNGDWSNLPLGEANLVAFRSGWGDGFYASYFGYDQSGAVCRLATDFNVLVEDIPARAVFQNLPSLYGKKLDHPDFSEAGIEIEIHPDPKKVNTIILEFIKGRPEIKMLDDEIKEGLPVSLQSVNRTYTVSYDCDLEEATLLLLFSKGVQVLE